MNAIIKSENISVWVDEQRCKGCDICVCMCPAGVLDMSTDPHRILGAVVKIIEPLSCIGCKDCELHCPDFAIFVSEKQDFKFAKLTKEAKQRAEEIKKKYIKSTIES